VVRVYHGGQLFPIDQVGTDSMTPCFIVIVSAVVPTIGIVLIVKMVLTVVIDQPIVVVYPTPLGREVKLGSEVLLVEII
jgi:hypothetical protein